MRIFALEILVFTILFSGCSKKEVITETPIESNSPNILLIIADDMGVDASPGYEAGTIKPNMPNLQKLSSTGITFDNVWAYPLCSPTRSSILTGKYGFRTGVLNASDASLISESEKSLHTYLDENTNNEYSQSLIGKWHLSGNNANGPTTMGIDYYSGVLSGGVPDYNSWLFTQDGNSSMYDGYVTTKITDLAINWINNQEKPWFCWLAYTAPHTPFHLPPDSMHSQSGLSADQASIDANPLPYFMAMCESIDYEMGRLFENIPADELENTIIIFLGDNGTTREVIQSPYTTTQAKGSLYQGGVHVPMIISGIGVSRINERDNNLISSTDLFSTVAEMAGIDLPTYQDSYSFNSLLSDAGEGLRDYNYSEVLGSIPNKSGYSIRDNQYKLIVLDSGNKKFYDLLNDPYESDNLSQGSLTEEQQTAMNLLEDKAIELRN